MRVQAGGSPKECQAAAAACGAELERLEHGLVMAYIDRKQAGPGGLGGWGSLGLGGAFGRPCLWAGLVPLCCD